ncbi:MAG: NAD-dependent epimerase/dehydratase family protein [Magnetococcales bacterium]|nr:NAD-dependent epimerase/dehydratase family protein [Magnetococcales bacterium]
MKRILVTGGAGFVGSNLAVALKRDYGHCQVLALDNLRRRGSEWILPRLAAHGVQFMHGDIRNPSDLAEVGPVDLLLECAAEPSVHTGYGGSPAYVLESNLLGLIHCLEYVRQQGGRLLFLSTSRVYPIDPLRALPLQEEESRLVIAPQDSGVGWSADGINESFPLAGNRSLYGASKLSAELLIAEYAALYGLSATILRCGVIAGPWQMGKVDQGVFVLWLARHLYQGPLSYMGFGGRGKQVRDFLHVDDLYDLLRLQIEAPDRFPVTPLNVGGGPDNTLSLCELSRLAREVTGCSLAIGSQPQTRAADIPYYVTDHRCLTDLCGWRPQRNMVTLAEDVVRWLVDHRGQLQPLLGG